MIGLQCLTCLHRHDVGSESGATTCDAFRAGIPYEILTGQVDHRHTYPGDNGLRYMPEPGVDTSEMDDAALEPLNSEAADGPLI